jgi:hypothetical protein
MSLVFRALGDRQAGYAAERTGRRIAMMRRPGGNFKDPAEIRT